MRMRIFLSLIRDSEKTRLDIFCYDEKEVPDLSEMLKKKFRLRERTKCSRLVRDVEKLKVLKILLRTYDIRVDLTNICQACRNAYSQERYLVLREKILKQAKAWRDKNKARLKLLAKGHYKRYRTKIIEKNKKYYQDHKEACQARKKLWRLKNEEKVRKYNKKYKLEHKITSF